MGRTGAKVFGVAAGQLRGQLGKGHLLHLGPLQQVDHGVVGNGPRQPVFEHGGNDGTFGSDLSQLHQNCTFGTSRAPGSVLK